MEKIEEKNQERGKQRKNETFDRIKGATKKEQAWKLDDDVVPWFNQDVPIT